MAATLLGLAGSDCSFGCTDILTSPNIQCCMLFMFIFLLVCCIFIVNTLQYFAMSRKTIWNGQLLFFFYLECLFWHPAYLTCIWFLLFHICLHCANQLDLSSTGHVLELSINSKGLDFWATNKWEGVVCSVVF